LSWACALVAGLAEVAVIARWLLLSPPAVKAPLCFQRRPQPPPLPPWRRGLTCAWVWFPQIVSVAGPLMDSHELRIERLVAVETG
jgi:hypothetical protein